MKRYFPTVKDFDRDEKGDVVWTSLKGPEKIEARQQLSRERLIAGAEVCDLPGKLAPTTRHFMCWYADEAATRAPEVVLLQGRCKSFGELQITSRGTRR